MRWHIVGGIISMLIGILMIAGGLFILGIMAYYNILYGPIEFSNGEYQAHDFLALTWKNILGGSYPLVAGIGLCVAAICWFKKKIRIGLLFFVLSFAVSGITAALIRNL